MQNNISILLLRFNHAISGGAQLDLKELSMRIILLLTLFCKYIIRVLSGKLFNNLFQNIDYCVGSF